MSSLSFAKLHGLTLGLILFLFTAVTISSAAPEISQSTSAEPILFLVDVEKAKSLTSQSPRTVFVDVRPEDDFMLAHIPGSLHLPLHHIKTKPYLKDLNLILVNRGFSLDSLRSEAKSLTEKGFSIHILAGGLAAWVQQGEKLSGSQPSTNDFHLISSFDFLAELHSTSRKSFDIFFVSDSADDDDDSFTTIGGKSLTVKKVSHLGEIQHHSTGAERGYAPVLICTAKSTETSIPAGLAAELQQTVFLLESGLEGLKKARGTITAMQKPKEMRTAIIEPCSICPSPETETSSSSEQCTNQTELN